MANGDTKTEALLNILGNGGSGDEYKGCCNTKTQQYILDAIDRINSLSPGGGAIKTLTDADAKGEYEGEKYVELWKLPSGIYVKDANTDFNVAYALDGDGPLIIATVDLPATFLVSNNDNYVTSITQTADAIAYVATDGSGNIEEPLVLLGNIFSGTDGDYPGVAGLVPAPSASDLGKFLSADGTWATAGGGSITPVQTTGTSTTDVMSQNAVSSMVFNDPAATQNVQIGKLSLANGNKSIAIGSEAKTNNVQAISIGSEAKSSNDYSTAIGSHADAGYFSVALGAWAKTTRSGEVNIGTGTSASGYSGTSYRVLGGVHDPVDNHDAATKGYVDGLVGNIETALNAINNGTGE